MSPRTARPGEAPRAVFELPVGLRFRQQGDFVEERAANLSTGGLFVRSDRPHPVGTVFEFELRPGGERPPIRGKAQVAWVRRRGNAPEEPAGMGARFVELDDDGRRRLAELAASREAGGEPVVEVDTAAAASAGESRADRGAPPPPAGAPPAGRAVPAAAPRAPLTAAKGKAQVAARQPVRRRWLLPAALALVALLGVALWPRRAGETPPAAPAEEVREVSREAPAPAAAFPRSEPAAAARPAPLRRVEQWARAWSEQRVDDYLATYSARFEPGGGLDRDAWERQRRTRILSPQRIEVRLAFIELEELSADRSRVRFVQAYESETYRDVVRKVLELELEPAGWKIVREIVEP